MRLITCLCMFLALPPIAAFAEERSKAPTIEAEIIGRYPGSLATIPYAINDRGQVVGIAVTGTGLTAFVAFIWSRQTGFELIQPDAVATDINEHGDVTLQVWLNCDQNCVVRGAVWNRRTGLVDLGTPLPEAINNRGDVAAVWCNGTDEAGAVCVIRNGIRSDLDCEEFCWLSGINESGDAVGSVRLSEQDHGLLLPHQGGVILLDSLAAAYDLDNSGNIAGQLYGNQGFANPAAVVTRDGTRQLTEGVGRALAINGRGWIVGTQAGYEFDGTQSVYRSRAFLYRLLDSTVEYLAPDPLFSTAVDINARGEILGSMNSGGSPQLVIWRAR